MLKWMAGLTGLAGRIVAEAKARRTRLRVIAIGLLATMVIALLAPSSHLIPPFERVLYDMRAQHCQNFTPPPTKDLIHIDIDEPAIKAIGRWPWSRRVLAELIDEIRLAGIAALAADITLSEPENPQWEPQPDRTF